MEAGTVLQGPEEPVAVTCKPQGGHTTPVCSSSQPWSPSGDSVSPSIHKRERRNEFLAPPEGLCSSGHRGIQAPKSPALRGGRLQCDMSPNSPKGALWVMMSPLYGPLLLPLRPESTLQEMQTRSPGQGWGQLGPVQPGVPNPWHSSLFQGRARGAPRL